MRGTTGRGTRTVCTVFSGLAGEKRGFGEEQGEDIDHRETSRGKRGRK